MRTIIFFGLTCLLFQSSLSQWSTSNKTQDAVFACPGFYSEIVTYPDGSSIVIGIGGNNEIWMQKFDPFGYKQWLPYVTVFPAMSGTRTFLPDDDGGVYAIVGTQAQRVDKYGRLSWGVNGKTILPSGSITKAVTDGKNGFIALYNRFDSLQRMSVLRYDSSGTKLWETEIDTSKIQNSFNGDIIERLSVKTLINSTKSGYKIITIEGMVSEFINDTIKSGLFFTSDQHVVAFDWRFLSVTYDSLDNKYWICQINKYDSSFSLIWAKQFMLYTPDISSLIGSLKHLSPDGFGGVFFHRSFEDSHDNLYTQIFRIAENSDSWKESIVIQNDVGRFPFSSKGQFGFVFDSEKGQKYDTSGTALWNTNFMIISDIDNSYFNSVESDHNGGAIISFWTVAGGIKVIHTGRTGKIGVLTRINSLTYSLPNDFRLFQNYPNPFNSTTRIKIAIPRKSNVQLKIFDSMGREILKLVDKELHDGIYEIEWSANELSSGIYFCRLAVENISYTNKMILLK